MYELRDPIHQTIEFDDREKAVIDHPVFQRMRYVRQLGLSYLVYPGATHDRFSHMLGAMHIAGRVWDNIASVSADVLKPLYKKNELAYFRRILRFAALLHDVGHAPFSHVSEKLMPKFSALEAPRDWYREYDLDAPAEHEDYSVMMIAALGRDPGVPIEPYEAQDIASLLHHAIKPSSRWSKAFGGKKGAIHGLLSALISGELDVDRMDYLMRDAHFTGVAYGFYDKDHLIRNLGMTLLDGRPTLTIDSTAMRAFEDFLLARYHMFLQVYHHKTTNGFDHFLKQAFARREVQIHVPGTVSGYLQMRDSTFLEALFSAAENPKNVWSRRFAARAPAKRLFTASGDHPESRETMRKLRKTLSAAGVPFFAINSHQYLSKLDAFKKFKKAGDARMYVREKSLNRIVFTPVEHYSSLLKKYNEVIDMVNLYVLPEHEKKALKAIGA
ncbi:MAG: HD domain-containing protein [Patescibacteria group bacterium]|nr:MAG: HD domain-containing protein [Patescibacteria group bacterium]